MSSPKGSCGSCPSNLAFFFWTLGVHVLIQHLAVVTELNPHLHGSSPEHDVNYWDLAWNRAFHCTFLWTQATCELYVSWWVWKECWAWLGKGKRGWFQGCTHLLSPWNAWSRAAGAFWHLTFFSVQLLNTCFCFVHYYSFRFHSWIIHCLGQKLEFWRKYWAIRE